MIHRYDRELQSLGDAYVAALSADTYHLARVVEAGSTSPLMSVGSGGSFSTAAFAAFVHEFVTGQMGRPVTPLEFLGLRRIKAGVACFSASGRNRDIGVAFKAAALREYRPSWALVLSENTAMHAIANRFRYVDIATFVDPSFKDGFLAVASLLASAALLVRSYETAADWTTCLPGTLEELAQATLNRDGFGWIIDETADVAARETVSVLHTPRMGPAAVDLESRFVEAALGSLHSADLRSFGHGRHLWLAKRAESTGVLALICEDHNKLANRTLALLPERTPVARIDIRGPALLQAIAGLLVGLHFAAAGGRTTGIDPGRPGVPSFGRKLYNLGPGWVRSKQSQLNRDAAIARKRTSSGADEENWCSAWSKVFERICTTPVRGLVLDYDGTISDPRKRFDPLPTPMRKALARAQSLDLIMGIATGRGPSAGVALREAIPEESWNKVIIGYYNGSIITTLSDMRDPIAEGHGDSELVEALRVSPTLQGLEIRGNDKQISIRLRVGQSPLEAVETAKRVIDEIGHQCEVYASSHSIDIVSSGASKHSVVEAVEARLDKGFGVVLRIGDKGGWPGNDAQLLDHPYGLSVDEVSGSLDHCWNLAPAGVLGAQATLYYLGALRRDGDCVRLSLKPSDRGDVDAA